MKVCATEERRLLINRLFAWLAAAHLNDPLASVQPPMFIIDNKDIKVVARLHPSNVTSSEQLVTVLEQTCEWQDNWSHQILEVIQKYDNELDNCRKVEADQSKAWQKQAKQEKDQNKFAEVSNEIAERIQQEVLRKHMATAHNTETVSEGAGIV